MADLDKQENQKTIVAFAAGLLIGGLLVWIFGGSPKVNAPTDQQADQNSEEKIATDEQTTNKDTEKTDSKEQLVTGEGKIVVTQQKAGKEVTLESAVFPTDEGWIGVRDYANGVPTALLGVARFSKSQGLVPEAVTLQRGTVAGNTYALVFYTESGDKVFSLTNDTQIGEVMTTFTAK